MCSATLPCLSEQILLRPWTQMQVLHIQVPVNTRWRLHNHHCVRLKVSWEHLCILCHPFSHLLKCISKHPFQRIVWQLVPITGNCHFLSSCFYSLCPLHLQLTGIVLCRCQKASEPFRAYVFSPTCVFCIWPTVFQIPLLSTFFLCAQTQKIPLADQTFGAIENQVLKMPCALVGTVLTPVEPWGCSRQQKEIINTGRKPTFWNMWNYRNAAT